MQAFSVFPSAILLGAPAGPTRVISIAAYQAASRTTIIRWPRRSPSSWASRNCVVVAIMSERARPSLSRPCRRREGLTHAAPDLALASRLWTVRGLGVLASWFVPNLIALIARVVVSSFATRWLGTWLPGGWTTRWYRLRLDEFQLGDVLTSDLRDRLRWSCCCPALLGVPAAYAMARRNFPASKARDAAVLLPRCWCRRSPTAFRSRPCSTGRVSPVRCRGVDPWPISCRRSIRDSVDDSLYRADRPAHRGGGAGVRRRDRAQLFLYVLLPLLMPGVLAALLLVLVRTIAMFELTFSDLARPARRWSSRSTTPCSPRASAPCNRSTPWRSSTWPPR